MEKRLGIFVCENYAPEALAALPSTEFPEVGIEILPPLCLSTPGAIHSINDLYASYKERYAKIVLFGGACLGPQTPPPVDSPHAECIHLNPCHSLLLNSATVQHFIRQGAYLVTNGWLHNYERNKEKWGFDEETARHFFRESARSLLWLDSGIPGDAEERFHEMMAFTGLPGERLPVGLDACRQQLFQIACRWRRTNELEQANELLAQVARQSADDALIFDRLSSLVEPANEATIVNRIFDLLETLYAPTQLRYTPQAGGEVVVPPRGREPDDEELARDFPMTLRHQGVTLGVVEIVHVAFPKYLNRYVTMAEPLSLLCGLAIANARKFQIIEEHKAALEKLNATKDKFFSIIAHDLRAPFNAILGLSELLELGYDDYTDDDRRRLLGSIHLAATNSFKLTENLLEWAQMQTGQLTMRGEPFDMAKLAVETVALLRPAAEIKQIQLTFQCAPVLPTFADAHAADAILRNLVNNAIKFTQPGGEITVSARREADFIRVNVKDNGVGIPSAALPNLFRIDAKRVTAGTADEKGTGLGLLLCHEFVTRNGGTISVTSEPGVGTEFSFTLPSAAPPPGV